ncbi:hypothetical protein [Actinomadura sp. 3N407]|uniref:hypothetical protein n=1 Tax=Actinomadura sp. 3N407 TaxID=3457423 RepID=UPI003FCCA24E
MRETVVIDVGRRCTGASAGELVTGPEKPTYNLLLGASMPMVSDFISFGTGILAGLLTNVLWDQRRPLRNRMVGRRRLNIWPLGFDPSSVDLYPINTWSVSRQLSPHRLKMKIADGRPTQEFFDQRIWEQLAEGLTEHSGSCAYLVAFDIDHRESAAGEQFGYTVFPCGYHEHLATVEYLKRHPETQTLIRNRLADGEVSTVTTASPPGLIKINVTVLNAQNNFLALQRSGAVHTKKGLWTTGPNETMHYEDNWTPGSRPEDLFGLAERCLREELGLERPDYGKVHISWIGYEATTLSTKVFSHVTTRLSYPEFTERLTSAHSLYEIQNAAWLPFTRRYIEDIMAGWRTGDQSSRRWSSSAPLALQEQWRFRELLNAELSI